MFTYLDVLNKLRKEGSTFRDEWDYMTALRGPDFQENSVVIKALFTAVIRGNHAMGMDVTETRGWLRHDIDLKKQWERIDKTIHQKDFIHYKHHISQAIDVLHRHKFVPKTVAESMYNLLLHKTFEYFEEYIMALRRWLKIEKRKETTNVPI